MKERADEYFKLIEGLEDIEAVLSMFELDAVGIYPDGLDFAGGVKKGKGELRFFYKGLFSMYKSIKVTVQDYMYCPTRLCCPIRVEFTKHNGQSGVMDNINWWTFS